MNRVLVHRSEDRVQVYAEVLGWETYQVKVYDEATGEVSTASRPIIGIEYADIRIQEVIDAMEGAYLPFYRVQ